MSNFSFLDKNLLRTRVSRAAHLREKEGKDAESVDFLLRWAEKEMIERLSDIRHEIKQCAVLSPAPSSEFLNYLSKRGVEFEVFTDLYLEEKEILPLEKNKFDAIISFFELHKINDLPGWLIQIKSALKEDGVLIACLAGEATLFQLRQSLLAAEMNILGGASPRVMPFISKQQMAALMQRAGFALPVVNSETVTATYKSIFTLMKDLRLMGETNAMTEKYKSFSPPGLFIETSKIYTERFAEENGRLPATFDVTFLIGWSPSDTQQKPLRRGSGQVNLTDFLASDTQPNTDQEKE